MPLGPEVSLSPAPPIATAPARADLAELFRTAQELRADARAIVERSRALVTEIRERRARAAALIESLRADAGHEPIALAGRRRDDAPGPGRGDRAGGEGRQGRRLTRLVNHTSGIIDKTLMREDIA